MRKTNLYTVKDYLTGEVLAKGTAGELEASGIVPRGYHTSEWAKHENNRMRGRRYDIPFSPEAPLGRGNNDDCSGADRCQRQMKGGEARAAFCFFKVPAKGLKKKQQTQPERQLRMLGAATRPCRAKRD